MYISHLHLQNVMLTYTLIYKNQKLYFDDVLLMD